MTIGAVPRCCGYYGEGSGPINVRVVSCNGSEANITSCSFVTTTVFDHQNDVGVQCQQGQSFLKKIMYGTTILFLVPISGAASITYCSIN